MEKWLIEDDIRSRFRGDLVVVITDMPAFDFVPHRFSIRRKVVLSFTLVLGMLGVISFISERSTRAFIENAEGLTYTREVMEIVERTRRHLMEMEADRRGYLITGDEEMLSGYARSQEKIIENYNLLLASVGEISKNPEQVRRMEQLLRDIFAQIQQSFDLQRVEIETRRVEDYQEAAVLFAKGASEENNREVQVLLTKFYVEQQSILGDLADETAFVGGRTKLTILFGSVFTFGALVWACTLILRDIAARRRAEAALAAEHNLLRSIIDTIPDHVFVKDERGRYILDNEAHRAMTTGLDMVGTVGRTVFDYFPPEDATRYHDDDRFVMETGERIINREDMVTGPDGKEVWLQTTKVPLRDVRGRIIGLVGIAANISDRKIAEERMRRFASQLEQSNTELKNFASVASHDLQEPLRKIQAFGGRLRAKYGGVLGDGGLDYLERMEGAAKRMATLIQDLLKLSRVTSRALPFEQCDLRAIALEVVHDLELVIEQKGAVVEIGNLPEIVGDRVQMQQLFLNLINNALKFTKAGVSPVVEVVARIYLPADPVIPGASLGEEVCEIRVCDNGIGFEACFAEQIFVVFQRLHTRDNYEGTGIGLAVCRKITDRHGGSILAKSSPAGGATFIVTLPLKQPTEESYE